MEMHRLEGEQIQVVPSTEAGKASVLSDADLDVLLDRSPAVFADRQKGWTSSGLLVDASGGRADAARDAEGKGKGKGDVADVGAAKVGVPDDAAKTRTAFAVYEAPAGDGNVLGMLDDLDDDGGDE